MVNYNLSIGIIATYFILLSLIGFIAANYINNRSLYHAPVVLTQGKLNFNRIVISFVILFTLASAFKAEILLLLIVSPAFTMFIFYKIWKINRFLSLVLLVPVLLALLQVFLVTMGQLAHGTMLDFVSVNPFELLYIVIATTYMNNSSMFSSLQIMIGPSLMTALTFTFIAYINYYISDKLIGDLAVARAKFQILSYVAIALALPISIYREQLFTVNFSDIFISALGLFILSALIWNIKYLAIMKIIGLEDVKYASFVLAGLTPLFVFALCSLSVFAFMQIFLNIANVLSQIRFTYILMGFYSLFFRYFYLSSAAILIPLFFSAVAELRLIHDLALSKKLKYFAVNTLSIGALFFYVLYWYLSFTNLSLV